ncbi:hypothetical protein OG749_46140 (plasmid) [Streptomyces nojiriensis]|uniref:hypothetical protein n=1 Tax=Streptomyces nojiriensis TaxID=66374 RepID=UPI002E193AC4
MARTESGEARLVRAALGTLVEVVSSLDPGDAAELDALVRQWEYAGGEAPVRRCGPPAPPAGEGRGRLVALVQACVRELAQLARFSLDDEAGDEEVDTAELLDGCFESLAALARELSGLPSPECAMPVWATAANFAAADPGRLLTAAQEIVSLAVPLADACWTARGLVRRAHALTLVALADPRQRLAAFDAVSGALRYVAAAEDSRMAEFGEILRWCARQDFLKGLVGVTVATFPGERSVLPEEDMEREELMSALRLVVRPFWDDADQADLPRLLPAFNAAVTEMENARAALERADESAAQGPDTVRASWTTFSFEHPAHARAVPSFHSLERTEGFDDILLEITHEIIHVVSMTGHLGIAMSALRAAAFERETNLWAFAPEGPEALALVPEVVPLSTCSVIALAEAEQCLEITHKLQILQATWAPWLEGIAVYGELAATPTAERKHHTPIESVLVNLHDPVELYTPSDQSEPRPALVARAMRRPEERLAQAQRLLGPALLRKHLQAGRAKYLAGYLSVRGVVSAWRNTLREGSDGLAGNLTGAQAFDALLHLTRYDTADALPPLDLPLEEFAVVAQRRMLDWIARAAKVSAADHIRLLDTPAGQPFGWQVGKLAEGRTDQPRDEAVLHHTWVAQAMDSLCGPERSPLHRVPDADDGCRQVMTQVSGALALQPDRQILSEYLLDAHGRRLAILPLGTTTTPFWLNTQQRRLYCVQRTTERHIDTGRPSYSLVSITLTEDRFAGLLAETVARPGERMTVTRVADLHPYEPGNPERGMGRNLIVHQYGDWLTAHLRGLFGSTEEACPDLLHDIRLRLLPPPHVTFEERLADGAGASRTAEWIASVDAWTTGDEDGEPLPVAAWARRVRNLAGMVQYGNAPYECAANGALLRRMLPDDLADELAAGGLRALVDTARDVGGLAEALHRTAVARGPDSWLAGSAPSSRARDIFQQDRDGWDVVPLAPDNER